MIPITAVINAAIFLREEITWLHLAGIACVLVGIFLVAWERAPGIPAHVASFPE